MRLRWMVWMNFLTWAHAVGGAMLQDSESPLLQQELNAAMEASVVATSLNRKTHHAAMDCPFDTTLQLIYHDIGSPAGILISEHLLNKSEEPGQICRVNGSVRWFCGFRYIAVRSHPYCVEEEIMEGETLIGAGKGQLVQRKGTDEIKNMQLMDCPPLTHLKILRREENDISSQVCQNDDGSGNWMCGPGFAAVPNDPFCIASEGSEGGALPVVALPKELHMVCDPGTTLEILRPNSGNPAQVCRDNSGSGEWMCGLGYFAVPEDPFCIVEEGSEETAEPVVALPDELHMVCDPGTTLEILRPDSENPAQVCRDNSSSGEWVCGTGYAAVPDDPFCVSSEGREGKLREEPAQLVNMPSNASTMKCPPDTSLEILNLNSKNTSQICRNDDGSGQWVCGSGFTPLSDPPFCITRAHNDKLNGQMFFNLGLPKSGTTSLTSFMTCGGVPAFHYKCGEARACASCIVQNLAEKKSAFIGCTYGDVTDAAIFTQNDRACLLPFDYLPSIVASMEPGDQTTFVMTTRSAKAWASSITKYQGGRPLGFLRKCQTLFNSHIPFMTGELSKAVTAEAMDAKERYQWKFFAPLDVTPNPILSNSNISTHALLVDFFKKYETAVHLYFAQSPHRLVVLKLENPDLGQLLEDTFGISSNTCWKKRVPRGTCRYFVCPRGYALKPNYSAIMCGTGSCVTSDRDICCKAN